MGDANPKDKAKTQAKGVSPISGVAPPANRQFGKKDGNPQGRGFWRKEQTPRYKLEQMLKLSELELQEVLDDKDAPFFERRLAKSLLNEQEFKTTEAMINQVYGTPKQTQETKIEADITGLDITFKDERKDAKS